MDKHTKEIRNIVDEYKTIHNSLNELQQDIQDKMNIHVDLNNKLDILREKEKEMINNIESNTGKKLSPGYLYNLMLNEQSEL